MMKRIVVISGMRLSHTSWFGLWLFYRPRKKEGMTAYCDVCGDVVHVYVS